MSRLYSGTRTTEGGIEYQCQREIERFLKELWNGQSDPIDTGAKLHTLVMKTARALAKQADDTRGNR